MNKNCNIILNTPLHCVAVQSRKKRQKKIKKRSNKSAEWVCRSLLTHFAKSYLCYIIKSNSNELTAYTFEDLLKPNAMVTANYVAPLKHQAHWTFLVKSTEINGKTKHQTLPCSGNALWVKLRWGEGGGQIIAHWAIGILSKPCTFSVHCALQFSGKIGHHSLFHVTFVAFRVRCGMETYTEHWQTGTHPIHDTRVRSRNSDRPHKDKLPKQII